SNDCPKAGGGRYWPRINLDTHVIEDEKDGRDFKLGKDSNKIEQQKIMDDIAQRAIESGLPKDQLEKFRKLLEKSRISDLTEFGRVVHAEMDALLACGRVRVSPKDGTLYSTTFPCHNCAKHIVSAGIKRV